MWTQILLATWTKEGQLLDLSSHFMKVQSVGKNHCNRLLLYLELKLKMLHSYRLRRKQNGS